MRYARGLTLVELLVAIAIFGVLSGVAYRALTVVLESRGRLDQENRKWREIALFLTRLEQDLAASAPRPIRDANNDSLSPALVGNPAPRGASDGQVMLTRTGVAVDPRAIDPPRRIGYRLRGGIVELLYWTGLDQVRSEPRTIAVLQGVSAMNLRYLDRRGQWHLVWPPPGVTNPQTEIPTGIEISVTLVSGERITRLLPTAVRLAL